MFLPKFLKEEKKFNNFHDYEAHHKAKDRSSE